MEVGGEPPPPSITSAQTWPLLCLQEYLLDFPTCIRTYEVAITSAEDFLGPEDPLTRKFRRTLRKALKDEERLQTAADREDQQRRKQMKYKCVGEPPSLLSFSVFLDVFLFFKKKKCLV